MGPRMHRVQSTNALYKFRAASALLCLKYVMVAVVAGLLVCSVVWRREDLTWSALGLGAATLGLMIAQWLLGSQTRCPLCMTPVLAGKGCSKHRNARPLLGSHRFRVATSILFHDSFRCPYCNEPTAMQVRERHHHG